jgi:chromate transporter
LIVDGILGLATTAFYTFLPSFIFILVGAPLVERTQENKMLKSIFSIVTATVVGVILNLTIYLGSAVIFPNGINNTPDAYSLAWVVVSFIALFRFKVNMIGWIGISALAGFIYQSF